MLLYYIVYVQAEILCALYKHNERGEHGDGEIEMTVEPPRDTRACSVSSRTLTERVYSDGATRARTNGRRKSNAIFKDCD